MRGSIEDQLGRNRGPGARPKNAPKEQDFFQPTKMNPALYMMTFIKNALPDPDEIMAKGQLHYQDLANLIRDGHVLSCVQQRKSNTMSHRIRIEPREGSSGEMPEKALKLCRRMVGLWAQDTRNTIAQILEALLMGMQPFELNYFYDNEIGGLIVERPRDLLQEWFRYTPDGALRYRPKPWVFMTESVPAFKVLMARNLPTMRNPYGVKLLSSCYWPTTFKRGGVKFFAEYIERFGMPTVDVETGANVSQEELAKIANDVIAMMRRGVIVRKGTYKTTLSDMGTKYQTTDAYDKFVALVDRENSKSLLGQTLTTDEGGSRAQGDIHKQILETLWKSDDAFVASVLTDLFDIITYVNFGPDVIGPMAIVGESMGTDRLDRDAKLRDFMGVDFTDEYLIRNYDLRAGDFVRALPLKASYAADPSIRPKEFSPSGAPKAGTEMEVVPEVAAVRAAPAAGGGATRDAPSRTSPKDGGSRKSEASKTKEEKRDSHRRRNEK